jgi:hypothetical protein
MGIFQRLLSREDNNLHQMSPEMAEQVVQRYGGCVATCAPLPGRVADTALLPYSKAVIKEALALSISSSADPELREHLRCGYLMLSAWQDGVGLEPLGPDFTRLNLEADPLEIATAIEEQTEAVSPWRPVIEAEQEVLQRELASMGL